MLKGREKDKCKEQKGKKERGKQGKQRFKCSHCGEGRKSSFNP